MNLCYNLITTLRDNNVENNETKRRDTMWETLPGTVIPYTPGDENDAFARFSLIFSTTGGITLSQLKEITGLEGSTIQNWVKRGWVANPHGKRYGEIQLGRILLINMMRGVMQLETIVSLMHYINGSVEDRGDDIIPDKELFDLLCRVLFQVEAMQTTEEARITACIAGQLTGYKGPAEDSKEKLSAALYIMTIAHLAAQMKKRVEWELNKL